MTADMSRTLGIVMAGEKGAGLHELTAVDCKAAVSFAGNYKIVDFAMASAVRSGLPKIIVATQHNPDTLHRHLLHHWAPSFAPGNLVLRQSAVVNGFAAHTLELANTAIETFAAIDDAGVDDVILCAGDQVYAMDFAALIAAHRASGAEATVVTQPVPVTDTATSRGITVDDQSRVPAGMQKPAQSVRMPGHVGTSVGVYVFRWQWLRAVLRRRAAVGQTAAGLGQCILQQAVADNGAHAYSRPSNGDGPAYWRDVDRLDAYRLAQLDFANGCLPCILPDPRGALPRAVPRLLQDVAAEQAIVLGGIINPMFCGDDRVFRHSLLDQSVVLPGACVMPGARLTKAIVASRTVVPSGLVVGEDPDCDARWFHRTPSGTTLVTNAMIKTWQASLRGSVTCRRSASRLQSLSA